MEGEVDPRSLDPEAGLGSSLLVTAGVVDATA